MWSNGPLAPQLVPMRERDERSAFHRHAAEGVPLLGGGAAILLQLADPRVARGVARHSAFRERPLDRLIGTLDYVYAVGIGDEAVAAQAVGAVNRRHMPVRGGADRTAQAYNAFDADAQRWVASTRAEFDAWWIARLLRGRRTAAARRPVTAALLPAPIRAAYGFHWTPRVERVANGWLHAIAAVWPLLSRPIRHAPMRAARYAGEEPRGRR